MNLMNLVENPQERVEATPLNILVISCKPLGNDHYHIIIMFNGQVIVEDSVHGRDQYLAYASKYFSQFFEGTPNSTDGEGALSAKEIKEVTN